MTKQAVETTNHAIRASIARKRAILAGDPENKKLAERLAYAERMLAAGERLASVMMPSGYVQGYLRADEREYLALYDA